MTDTKQQILQEFEKQILSNGIFETSMSDIANAVGIAKGTLYHHYSSKEQLLDAVVNDYFAEYDKTVQIISSLFTENLPAAELMRNSLIVLEQKKSYEQMHYILITYAITRSEDLRQKFYDKYLEWRETLSSKLTLMTEEGDNVLIAELLLSMFDGLATRNMVGLTPLSAEEMKKLFENSGLN